MYSKEQADYYTTPKRKLLCALVAVCSSSLGGQVAAQDNQPAIEEVLVTGSFIRRTEGFRASSPVTQISADDIAQFGAPNVGDMISSMSFNSGTPTSANILGSTATTGTTQGINLRGLGSRATLNLVDGLRINGGNVNTFLPQIAIQRLDIVTDGAAALYGTAAVAGVANFVPRKSFDGVRVEGMYQGDHEGDYDDVQLSLIGGTEWNGINIVAAIETRSNGALEFLERPEQFRSGLSFSGTPNPGRYNVPVRDANGEIIDTARVSDPNCGGEVQDRTTRGNNPRGFTLFGQCWFEFGEFHDYRTEQDTTTAYTNLSYDVNDDMTLALQVSAFDRESLVRRSPSSSGGSFNELPAIRGEIPGNPFPAVDANGNQLHAQDANGDGIPDRDDNNQVILDPGGIPFNEDVTFNSWRPFGKHGTLPSMLNADGSRDGGTKADGYRTVLSADYPVPVLQGWQGATDVTIQRSESRGLDSNYSTSALAEALNCDVLNQPGACFNPFVSTDDSTLNEQALVDRIAVAQRSSSVSKLRTFDTNIGGDVSPFGFELPGGVIGAALGFQWRQRQERYTPTPLAEADDRFNGAAEFASFNKRNVHAFFGELLLPALDNLDVQVALRRESYSSGQSSTDPKVGIVYSPMDNLILRASAGTSFVAPSMSDLHSPESCGLGNVDDPFSEFAAFVQVCSAGNPNLVPESADTMSLGLTWDITNNLTVDLDWSETDFVDRIVSVNQTDILEDDWAAYVDAFGQPSTADGLPTLEQLRTWINDPRSDKRIVRNPTDITVIEQVTSGSSNASSELVRATDLKLSYSRTLSDWGDLQLTTNATYIDTHLLQLGRNEPTIETIGQQNDFTGAVPPLPRWKANGTIAWNLDRHSARISAYYTDSVIYDGPSFSFMASMNPYYSNPDEIKAMTTVDASYTYSDIGLFGGSGSITVGSRNLFDRRPTNLPGLGGTEAFLYDPTGRMLYARLAYDL